MKKTYLLKSKLILIVFIFLTTFSSIIKGQVLVVPPNPGNISTVEHLTQSNDYTVEVKKSGDANYTTCFVYKTDNYATTAKKAENSLSFTNVSFSGTSIDVRVTCKFTANSVTIRPLNFGIIGVRAGNVITFTLNKPTKLSIEVNDRTNPLFFFADAPDVPNTNATYYYAPGTVTNIGLLKTINSGESVYIAGGAVVEGSFSLAEGSKNISIKGRGILCMGQWLWQSNDLTFLGDHSMIKARSTSYLQMEGIILANSTGWHIPIYNGGGNLVFNNQFRNLKLISWNPNSDGIWVNGKNHIVDDCFIFNNDDAIMSHSITDSKVSNMIIWGGPWGRVYMHSGQDTKPLSDNMTLENFNVIGKDSGNPELILANGSSGFAQTISNFTFKNWRVEKHPNSKFLNINVSGNKNIKGWHFEDITLDDKYADEGDIHGAANSPIDVVTFCNIKMAGNYVTSLAAANMDKNSYATNVTFCTNTEVDNINNSNNSFIIYPNPANDYLIVAGDGDLTNCQIELYDILGKKIVTQIINTNNFKIDISGFNKGIYFFKIISLDNTLQTGKLIKE